MSPEERAHFAHLIDSGKVVDLVQLSRKWTLADGPGAEAFHLAGLASRGLRWFEEAAANFQSAVLLDPSLGQYWADAGEAWYRLRQLETAEYAWTQAEALGALDDRALRLRAIAGHARRETWPSRADIAALAGLAAASSRFAPSLESLPAPIIRSLGPGHDYQISLQVDGIPNSYLTPIILDLLRARRIKAAFFVTGSGADANILARIAADGHAMYNRGYSGGAFAALDDAAILEELTRTEELLRAHRPTPSPYPIRLPGRVGLDDPRIHAALRRFYPQACIVQGNVIADDVDIFGEFVDDADVGLAAQLCCLEAMTSAALDRSILETHDQLPWAVPPHPTFIRHFYEMLISRSTEAGFTFAPADAAATVAEQASPTPVKPAVRPSALQVEILRVDSANIGSIEDHLTMEGVPLGMYRRTMQLPWINHDFPYAHLLIRDSRCVGWLQSIYADRLIGGRIATVCNLSSWFVAEEFRSHSMALMFAALRDAGSVPVTAMTSSGLAAQIYRALKFRILDEERYALPLQEERGPHATSDGDAVFYGIDAAAKRIYNDHRTLSVRHCLIPGGRGRGCYFSYQTRDRLDLKVADLMYIGGDVDLLLSGQWRPPPASPLAECRFLLIDARFLQGRQVALERIDPFNPRFYKGAPEIRSEIDFMYSEIAIFPQSML